MAKSSLVAFDLPKRLGMDRCSSDRMTAEQVRAIRDQVGGTKAMAELLDMSERAVRYMLRRGVGKTVMVRAIRGLVDEG